MDNCLPGIASNVKRAATSAIRPAPLVITVKLITVRIRKITIPTTKLPLTTNSPNASIRSPASASDKIRRVVPTFRPNRYNVKIRSNVGNPVKSEGFLRNRITSRINIARARLTPRSMSITI